MNNTESTEQTKQNTQNTESAIDYKPKLNTEDSSKLIEKLYGVKCLNISELNGYDDKNYKVIVELVENKYLTNICLDGYVFKILNSLDSIETEFIEEQIKILLFLGNRGISCPKPVRNINGNYYTLEEISGKKHVVRLLEFQPGKIFFEVEKSNFLFYRVGEYIAHLDNILKDYSVNDAILKHQSIWKLDSVPKIQKYIFCLNNKSRQQLVKEVIENFEQFVLPKTHELEKGIIHGDFNEQNIVVGKNSKNVWDIKAVLDFGDMNYSCYLFELAITITYAILQSRDIATAGYVLAGYGKVRKLPKLEIDLLQICIAARLVQSLVLGFYANYRDPSNTYVLTTQTHGWDILEKICREPQNELIQKWFSIADNYTID